jgi:hypothetical protein
VCERVYDEIWSAHGDFDVDDPATWPGPVLRFSGSIAQPFFAALTSTHLERTFDRPVRQGALGARRAPHRTGDAGRARDGMSDR